MKVVWFVYNVSDYFTYLIVPPTGKKTFLGAFVDWDNSPRRKYDAYTYQGASPDKFRAYLERQLTRAKSLRSDFLFINAWNEWTEGTYLEPDTRYGFQYLEAVKKASATVFFRQRSSTHLRHKRIRKRHMLRSRRIRKRIRRKRKNG